MGEYELIQALDDKGCFDELTADSASLTLFKKHFIMMNTLYQLQREYVARGHYLSITPLSITLQLSRTSKASNDLAESDAHLAHYYLDWSNYHSASDESVAELLTSFWKDYAAHFSAPEAYDILGVPKSAEWSEVQVCYRRLAKEHHPDNGGDAEQFHRIRQAYETLKSQQAKSQ